MHKMGSFSLTSRVRIEKMAELNPVEKIIVLTTGGTIEKTYDEIEGSLRNRETIIRHRIEDGLRLPYTKIEVKSIMAKDSLDMTEDDRFVILASIKELASAYKTPIVVLHGTDTMQQTAEIVEAQWKDISVPVVFTGAMRPLGFVDTDAVQNVVEAMVLAKVLVPGVYISFHSRLFHVPGVRKNKAKGTFEAF
jgi:L-asparaginase